MHIWQRLSGDNKGAKQGRFQSARTFEAHKSRMPIRRIDIRHFLFFLAIEIRQSKFGNSFGGIAQLVERQLCKLEVRGSNPLASKAEGVEAKFNKMERYQMH